MSRTVSVAGVITPESSTVRYLRADGGVSLEFRRRRTAADMLWDIVHGLEGSEDADSSSRIVVMPKIE
jgi:hypothetical protein